MTGWQKQKTAPENTSPFTMGDAFTPRLDRDTPNSFLDCESRLGERDYLSRDAAGRI
jgi:hypothetical protein